MAAAEEDALHQDSLALGTLLPLVVDLRRRGVAAVHQTEAADLGASTHEAQVEGLGEACPDTDLGHHKEAAVGNCNLADKVRVEVLRGHHTVDSHHNSGTADDLADSLKEVARLHRYRKENWDLDSHFETIGVDLGNFDPLAVEEQGSDIQSQGCGIVFLVIPAVTMRQGTKFVDSHQCLPLRRGLGFGFQTR